MKTKLLILALFASGSLLAQNTFPANGDVGIGTNAPTAKLDVNGVIQTYNKDTQYATWDNLRMWSDGVSSYIHSNGDEDGLVLKSNIGNKILLMSRVGIGITSPTEMLDLSGNIKVGEFLNGNTSWVGKQNSASGIFYSGIGFTSTGNEDFITFRTHLSGISFDERMRITSTGNVGIGTTIPDSKLTVKGKIHAEEVKVDLNVPGPDYVFEKSYDLKSLSEVETFIDQNKHLPEVPSAKSMKEEGINVGEMQMNLLKKIEELTLYLIEQKKEITSLKQEVAALKK